MFSNMKSSNINVHAVRIVTSFIGIGVSVTVYNPASQKVHSYVRVPVSAFKDYSVVDSNGKNIPFDCLPIPEGVKKLAERYVYV